MGVVMGILLAVILVLPFWRICARAGFPAWISLLILLPVANLVLLYFLAFAEWPVLRGLPSYERIDGPRRD